MTSRHHVVANNDDGATSTVVTACRHHVDLLGVDTGQPLQDLLPTVQYNTILTFIMHAQSDARAKSEVQTVARRGGGNGVVVVKEAL